jgi:hypothetical protein
MIETLFFDIDSFEIKVPGCSLTPVHRVPLLGFEIPICPCIKLNPSY